MPTAKPQKNKNRLIAEIRSQPFSRAKFQSFDIPKFELPKAIKRYLEGRWAIPEVETIAYF